MKQEICLGNLKLISIDVFLMFYINPTYARIHCYVCTLTNLQIEDPILGNLIANWKTIQVIKRQLAQLEFCCLGVIYNATNNKF